MSSCSVCGKTADFCQNGNKYHRLKNNELFCDKQKHYCSQERFCDKQKHYCSQERFCDKQKHYCSQECALEDYGIEFANIREDD